MRHRRIYGEWQGLLAAAARAIPAWLQRQPLSLLPDLAPHGGEAGRLSDSGLRTLLDRRGKGEGFFHLPALLPLLARQLSLNLPAVPAGLRAELSCAISTANLHRLRATAWMLALVMPVMAELDRRVLQGMGTNEAWDAWLYLAFLRSLWMFAAVLFLASSGGAPVAGYVTNRQRNWEMAFPAAALGISALHVGVGEPVGTGITVYLLCVFLVAAFIQMDWQKALVVYGSGLVVLLVVLWQVHGGRGTPPGPDLVNGVLMTVMAAVVSQMAYATRVREYMGGRLIDRQRAELERANQELALANEKLKKSSLLDSLTGVPNRRSLAEQMDREWKRAAREGASMATIMVDVDRFKQFNDRFGHQAGDLALVEVAETLKSCLQRPSDLIARYGGDEFAVVLPGMDLPGACRMAERMLRAVVALRIPHPDSSEGRVTVSLGVCSRQPADGEQLDGVISAADSALYRAKDDGRNRIFWAP